MTTPMEIMCQKHQFETRNEIYTVFYLKSIILQKNKKDLKYTLN